METLIVMAKAPVIGRAKTRLAPALGDETTLSLARAFLQDTAVLCRRWQSQSVAADPNRRVVVYATPDLEHEDLVAAAAAAGATLELQRGDDLGARLQSAFVAEFDRGARAVCAIGTDSPHLPAPHLDHAYRALQWERVTLGPTFDGGYWLVGAQRPAPALFDGIAWSTATVLEETLALCRRQGVEPHLLPYWYDVDEPPDLLRLVSHLRSLRAADPAVAAATWQALSAAGLVNTATERSA